jgi:chemotaxis protein MotB
MSYQDHNEQQHDDTNWLVSYADMMTLLCGFFIMIFSISKLDQTEYEKLRESVSKTFKGKFESPIQEQADVLNQIIEQAGLKKDAIVTTDASGVSVAFKSKLFFESGSAQLLNEGKTILDHFAQSILDQQKRNHQTYRILVEGHTDQRPIVSSLYPSNWELSGARASRVVRLFVDQGFDRHQLMAIGYADTRPAEEPSQDRSIANSTQNSQPVEVDSYSKDRRVIIRVMKIESDSVPVAANTAH